MKIRCPKCSKEIDVPASAVGKRATCKCGAKFRVPFPKQDLQERSIDEEMPAALGMETAEFSSVPRQREALAIPQSVVHHTSAAAIQSSRAARHFSITSLVVGILIGLPLGFACSFFNATSATKNNAEAESIVTSPTKSEPIAGLATRSEPIIALATKSVAEAEPIVVLRKYLEQPGWRERLPLVRDPERVRPLMEKRWEASKTQTKTSDLEFEFSITKDHGDWVAVDAKATHDGRSLLLPYYLLRTEKGYKVDWEASVGYNPKALRTFTATVTEETIPLRLDCQLSNLYVFTYRDAESSHLNIQMHDSSYSSVNGYINRSSAAGRRISSLLEDGGRHKLTLKLQHASPSGRILRSTSDGWGATVAITELISDSWVVPPGAQ